MVEHSTARQIEMPLVHARLSLRDDILSYTSFLLIIYHITCLYLLYFMHLVIVKYFIQICLDNMARESHNC